MRDFLRKKATIETVIDFGDHQIFEGVTTYPAILTMRGGAPPPGHELQFWTIDAMPADSFADAFDDAANPFPQSELGRGSWELEGEALRSLRAKIMAGKPTLKEVYGSPLYGIKTGLNEAFVIDTPTKERLCAADPCSAELLRPWLEGKDLKRWRAEPRGLWIIYIPKSRLQIDDYPAIRDWLLPFKEQLERRATKQQWFELQQAQEAYSQRFGEAKITYSRFLASPEFWFDNSGHFINNALFSIATSDPVLLALLNSSICWFHLTSQSTNLSGGFSQADAEDLDSLPIPPASDAERLEIGQWVATAQAAAKRRHELQQSIARRIPDLAADPANAKLPTALKQWWHLPDFAAFQRLVRGALKADIPLKQRSEWEDWITTTRAEINTLSAEVSRLEAEINAKVYALFNLTPAEIELLEASI